MTYPLIRQWYHAWNQKPANQATSSNLDKSILFFIQQVMMGTYPVTNAAGASILPNVAWPLYGSSDSVTAGLDGINRITSYNKWVNPATALNGRSWLVLGPGPNGGYINFDYGAAPGAPQFINFYHSLSAPTGGSIFARPTAVDETAVSSWTLPVSSATTFAFHGITSSAGDIWCGFTPVGTGYVAWDFGWHYLGNPKPSDKTPWITWFGSALGFPPGAPSSTVLLALNGNNVRMRPPDNTGAQGTSILGTGMLPVPLAPNSLTEWIGVFPSTGDAQDSSWAGWPVPMTSVFTSGSTLYTVRGNLVDIMVSSGANGSSAQVGNLEPAVGQTDAVILGNFWLPCNVPLVVL